MDFLDAYKQYCASKSIDVHSSVEEAVDASASTQQSVCSLQLRGAGLTDEQVEAVTHSIERSALPEFRLTMHYGMVTDAAVPALCNVLESNVGITHLDLSWNSITSAGVEQLCRALAVNSTLLHLSLTGNPLDDKAGVALGSLLERNQTLQQLRLARCSLGTNSVKSLAWALRQNHGLQLLDVNDTRSDGSVRDMITALRDNQGLLSINYSKCTWMDDEGAAMLAAAVWEKPRLQSVDLSACKIAGPGVAAMAPFIASDPPLQVLKLSRCRVCDEGAIALAAALGSNTHLQELWLEHAEIGQDGLLALLAALPMHPRLHVVKLWGNDWPEGSPAADALAALVQDASGGVEGVEGEKTGATGGAGDGIMPGRMDRLLLDVIVYEGDGLSRVALADDLA